MNFTEFLVNILLIIIFIYTFDKLYIFIKNKLSLKEHLIENEADIIDNIESHSLAWLKNKAKIMDINDSEIKQSNLNNNIKRSYSLAIYYNMNKYRKSMYELFNTYDISKLIRLCNNLNILIPKINDSSNLKNVLINDLINHELNSIKSKSTSIKSKSTSISSKKHKKKIYKQQFLRKCPILNKKCKKDYVDNPDKYKDCFKMNDFQDCIVCFNNKISSSNFLGKGFKTDCNYNDLELLCNENLYGTCKRNHNMICPCIPENKDEFYSATNKKHINYNKNYNTLIDSKYKYLSDMNSIYTPFNLTYPNHSYLKRLNYKYLKDRQKDIDKRFGKNHKDLLDILTKEENMRKNMKKNMNK